MPSYSSDEFLADWRYAVEQDLTTSAGEPYPYADGGRLQWGDETRKITLKGQSHLGCVSYDGKRLALAVEHDIHVVDTQSWETIVILKGHTSKIDSMAFRPRDAKTLISSDEPFYDGLGSAKDPTIILWNIEEEQATTHLDEDSLGNAARAAASAAAKKLAEDGISLDSTKVQDLGTVLEPAIGRVVSEHMIAGKVTLEGQLVSAHQSQMLSPSGKWLAYIPGKRPRSNRSDPWDIKILSTDDLSEGLTLEGHTDAMMWLGWNIDESLFASVSWDGSIRVWDFQTGYEKYHFNTEHQNWTGGFSSDSKYFAAIDGEANVRVYSMDDGELYWMYEGDTSGWRRTVSWHPNNSWLAVGGERGGELLLLDVKAKTLLQRRVLSIEASTSSEEVRSMMKGFVGVGEVKFLDDGKRLAVWTYGDWSIEVYDIKQEVKWRFARGGTEDGPGADKWRNEQGKVTSGRGYDMLTWEDRARGVLQLCSLDFDGVRIWEVPL
ncbi:serine threonine kinase [Fusarium heterosporum]|uniref:Serine threonine kinase n=1 Tax=Fusarium heterosporum TaxID=42747 RepID=A0A8H5T7F1_FUSHE|nr:serine threonine kinase [Fusarium heterosporum]